MSRRTIMGAVSLIAFVPAVVFIIGAVASYNNTGASNPADSAGIAAAGIAGVVLLLVAYFARRFRG